MNSSIMTVEMVHHIFKGVLSEIVVLKFSKVLANSLLTLIPVSKMKIRLKVAKKSLI